MFSLTITTRKYVVLDLSKQEKYDQPNGEQNIDVRETL
jgi:hypothetical protein